MLLVAPRLDCRGVVGAPGGLAALRLAVAYPVRTPAFRLGKAEG